MPTTSPIAPLASAARTGTDVGASVDLVQMTTADLSVVVTAISSGASLAIDVETSADQVVWRPLEQGFLPSSAIGVIKGVFPGADRYLRVRWTITGTGTPSVTFAVTGTAVLVYATPDDLGRFGIPNAVLDVASREVQDRFLRLATDVISGIIQNHYGLPLASWGDDLRNDTCSIAAWMILSKTIGVNPESDGDKAIRDNHNDARKNARAVADGDAEYFGAIDSTPDEDDGGAQIYSDAPRGWNR
jgi:phage gp36-like protein